MAKVGKTSRYRKYEDGLWLKSRYSLYLWWFKFLRLAEQDPTRTVDWSKYDGWGGRDAILTQRFETWWKEHWRDLFAVKKPGDQARYEISNLKARAGAIRVAYIVYTHRDKGSNEDICAYLQKQKRFKNLPSLDPAKPLETKYANQNVKRYRQRAEKLLNEVCAGRFG